VVTGVLIAGSFVEMVDAVPRSALGFIALGLLQQRGAESCAGQPRFEGSRPAYLLCAGSSRRSGCVPAEPYPPLEQMLKAGGSSGSLFPPIL